LFNHRSFISSSGWYGWLQVSLSALCVSPNGAIDTQ
jgi:hypothetical protein